MHIGVIYKRGRGPHNTNRLAFAARIPTALFQYNCRDSTLIVWGIWYKIFCQISVLEVNYLWFSRMKLYTIIEVQENFYLLNKWVKRDQLDVTYFIISLYNAQHVSDVNISILRSLRLMCSIISWVILSWFDVLELHCGMAVVVWYPYAGWGTSASTCIRIPHHHSHTTT